MMKGIQLKEEMSTWLWDLPNYFKIKENPDYEEKLINLMLNGLRLCIKQLWIFYIFEYIYVMILNSFTL